MCVYFCLVTKLCLILCNFMDCSLSGFSVHGILQARILEWVALLPDPGIKLWFPALQVDFLPSELPEKLKNTGMGNLSLLQGNFPTQELNWGLLHCRQIPYQMSWSMDSPPKVKHKKWTYKQGSKQMNTCPV